MPWLFTALYLIYETGSVKSIYRYQSERRPLFVTPLRNCARRHCFICQPCYAGIQKSNFSEYSRDFSIYLLAQNITSAAIYVIFRHVSLNEKSGACWIINILRFCSHFASQIIFIDQDKFFSASWCKANSRRSQPEVTVCAKELHL